MSIDAALTSALSGIKANQRELAVTAGNIVNANNPDYSRRIISQSSEKIGETSIGVSISVARHIDQFLVTQIREKGAQAMHAGVRAEFYERISLLYGTPGESNSLNDYVDNFFSEIQHLSLNPELASMRTNAVNAGSSLASNLNRLVQELHTIRQKADNEIAQSFNQINQMLRQLDDINSTINDAENNNADTIVFEEKRQILLEQLSQEMDINLFITSGNQVHINTSNGVPLLNDNLYQLSYTPLSDVQSLLNKTPFSPMTVSIVEKDGSLSTNTTPLLPTINGTLSTANIGDAKFKALIDLRDTEIPTLITQLDNLAYSISNQVNAIHNQGTSYPPPSELTGTVGFMLGENHQFNGSVRIAALDVDGNALDTGYSNDPIKRPLTLDLSKLDSGQGVGQPTLEAIVDEINHHFGPPQQQVQLGPFANISIASVSSNLVENGNFTFDFEVDNNSNQVASFEVLDVTVIENGYQIANGNLPASLTIDSGTKTRGSYSNDGNNNYNLTVDLAGAGAGPVTIQTMVKSTDVTGKTTTALLEFTVPIPPNASADIRNDRFNINQIISGEATLTIPNSNQRYITASLVNSKGLPASAGEVAFLQLSGNQDTRIAIDSLDSIEQGKPPILTETATHRGFSHFFGLNNFFKDAPSIDQAAQFIQLEERIANDPNSISLGQLTPISEANIPSQPVSIDKVAASGSILFNGQVQAGDTVSIDNVVFTFVTTPPANVNEVQIGGTLADTLANLASRLNNSTDVNVSQASYTATATALSLTYDQLGSQGNQFAVAFNFASGQTASLNGASATTVGSSTLQGGVTETNAKSIVTHGFELGSGNNSTLLQLANLSHVAVGFLAAGGLPQSLQTLSHYSGEITSFMALATQEAADELVHKNLLLDGFKTKHMDVSGVNVDEEMANTIAIQTSYQASAKVIAFYKEFSDILFDVIN